MDKKDFLINIMIIAVIIAIAGSSLYLIYTGISYKKARDAYKYEKTLIVTDSDTGGRYVDFGSLQKESSGACAWIFIPDTNIDYPLVQGSDNLYYLSHDAYGNESRAGAVFLDCGNSVSLNDAKSVIYGHNMKDGSMFHDLRCYADEDFAENHPYLYIYMDDNTVRKYAFHSTALVNAMDELVYTPVSGESVSCVLEYLDTLAGRVYGSCNTENNILVLSTCQSGDNRRVVVFQEEL